MWRGSRPLAFALLGASVLGVEGQFMRGRPAADDADDFGSSHVGLAKSVKLDAEKAAIAAGKAVADHPHNEAAAMGDAVKEVKKEDVAMSPDKIIPLRAGAEGLGEKEVLKQKAHAVKDNFMSLSHSALELQCKQLEMSRQSGKQKWMEEEGIFESLSKMCDALKDKDAARAVRVAREQKEKVRGVATASAGKSVALGCTYLLKAKNDGKMEWFETQAWYRKAMQMCTSLSGASPEKLQEGLHNRKGKWMQNPTRGAHVNLLKDSCKLLSAVSPEHAARKKTWFPKAEHMCATVLSANPKELRELVMRQQRHAETASGQLVKQTCEKLEHDKRIGRMKEFSREKWYSSLSRMCMKFGTRNVRSAGIQKRCQWFQKMKEQGKDKAFETQKWYHHLQTTCNFVQREPAQQSGDALLAKDLTDHVLV